MHVKLIMAMTLNGYTAQPDGRVPFISKEVWQSYLNEVGQAGNLILGRKTYDLMEPDEFIPSCAYVILTKTPEALTKKGPNVTFSSESPAQVIAELAQRGFETVLIGGGSETNRAFLDAQLVDELQIDIEPAILKSGLPLIADGVLDIPLKLQSVQQVTDQTLRLTYSVEKAA